MFEDFTRGYWGGRPSRPLVHPAEPSRNRLYLAAKRGFDIAAVLLSAPLILVLIGALALLVRRDGGRAFYCQPRLGKHGRIFLLWKLRSMVPDADARLARHLSEDPAAAAEWAKAQKLRHDPRITGAGRWLRKYSLDELPQLWNVLIGDMSLVGPRPMFPEQQVLYPGSAYFDFRPGLTGLWQISKRNQCSFAERADFDNRYAQTASFIGDLGILMQTVSVVLRGTGY
jgi:lipopolysaccharide/colanic/teichoic acid biosynthesis glycosyltransferase